MAEGDRNIWDGEKWVKIGGGDGGGGGLLVTGQTTSYRTGDDGDIQAGIPRDYTDNGDGTITDHTTGLMWKKYVEGLDPLTGTGSNATMNWNAAIDLANDLSFAGHSDWRLPNITELVSLVDYGVSSSPTINTTYFPNTPAANTWSSSTGASFTSGAWVVNFYGGDTYVNGKTFSVAVRCVRQI